MNRWLWSHVTAFSIALVFCGSAASAQDIPVSRLAKARELVEASEGLSHVIDAVNAVIPLQIDAQRKAHPEIPPEYWDEFTVDFIAELKGSLDQLETPLAGLYAMHFTDAEMDALIKFYQSDIGKKALHETPLLLQEAVNIGGDWGKQAGARAAARAAETLRQRNATAP